MNILFFSKDLSGGDLGVRLNDEGHQVRLFLDDEGQSRNYEGILERVAVWENQLDWVGKDGLIVFDSVGYGKIQDDLRAQGFSVVGGSALSDKLEYDRQYGQKIFSVTGIPIVSSCAFTNPEEAIEFIKQNEGPWVLKQNGHVDKIFNYVGKMKDGRDVIDVLKNYCNHDREECDSIDLQKKIEGIEIGVARYFNGNDWVGPIEMNLEHKDLCAGNLGPKTYEMGTVIWYEENENNKLFQETLAKLKPYLQDIEFKGDVDINCIVNGDVVYPLEVTTRFGWPSTHVHTELHLSPWGNFLKAIADGKPYDLKYKKGYGIVVLVATPVFPYQVPHNKYSPDGEGIYFTTEMTEDEMAHIHFEDVTKSEDGVYRVYGDSGFVLHVTHVGSTVSEARENVRKIIEKIVIPKMFYRTDIGLKFIEEDEDKLRKWGWI